MKKLFVFMLTMLFLVTIYSDAHAHGHDHDHDHHSHDHDHDHGELYSPTHHWGDDLNLALRNTSEGEFILLEFGKPWCHGYMGFAEETLHDPVFLKYAQDNFELVSIIHTERPSLTKYFRIVNVPTYIVLNHYGQEVDRVTGYNRTAEFIAKLEAMRYGKNTFLTLRKKMTFGHIDLSEMRLLGKKYYERNMFDRAEGIFNQILFTKKDADSNKYLGHIAIKTDREKLAEHYYEKAISLAEKKDIALYDAGYTAYMARDHKKAAHYMGRLIKLIDNGGAADKYYYWAHYLKALSHVFLREFDKADSLVETMTERFPDKKNQTGQVKMLIFRHKKAANDHDIEHFHEGCGGVSESSRVK